MRNNILPPVKRGDTWTFTFSWKNQKHTNWLDWLHCINRSN